MIYRTNRSGRLGTVTETYSHINHTHLIVEEIDTA